MRGAGDLGEMLEMGALSCLSEHGSLRPARRRVVRFCNKRALRSSGSRKAGKQAVKMTRISCHRFRSNEVRLALSLLAYNLGNRWRRLVLPQRFESWSLTSLQQRLRNTGGRLVKHASCYWLLLAESHLTRRLFGSTRRMATLPVPTGKAGGWQAKNQKSRSEKKGCRRTRFKVRSFRGFRWSGGFAWR